MCVLSVCVVLCVWVVSCLVWSVIVGRWYVIVCCYDDVCCGVVVCVLYVLVGLLCRAVVDVCCCGV